MGKIQILTYEQQVILSEVKQNSFFKMFYFTGGTALSAFYLNHRYSEDLDFFSEKQFDTESLLTLVVLLSKKHNFTFTSEFLEVVYIFLLTFKNNKTLKVDFAFYPHKQLREVSIIEGTKTDSFMDIAVNKLFTITQRSTIKDFVDLYFVLQKYTLWDLIEGVRIKFRMQLEPFIVASHLLKVEDFDFLPRMIKPLTLDELKSFFRQEAKEIAGRSTD